MEAERGSGSRTGLFRSASCIAGGIGAAVVLVFLVAAAGHLALGHQRLIAVAREGMSAGELDWDANRDEEYFTECALLTMQYFRRPELVRDVLDTRFTLDGSHPCAMLGRLLAGDEVPPRVSYINYPFGSRFLEAIVLSATGLHQAKLAYRLLSYGSVLLLMAAALRRSSRAVWLALPLGAFLLLGFGLHRFGHNLAHAPGFFVGFLALAAFLAAPKLFGQWSRRLAFFAFLGTLVAFFDLLHGSIPTVLSLAIVLNHFFPSSPREADVRARVRRSAREALAIVGCFAVSYGALTVARLSLLHVLFGNGTQPYFSALAIRLSNQEGSEHVRAGLIVARLWGSRYQMSPGGAGPVTWAFLAALSAWLFTWALLVLAFKRSSRLAASLSVDTAVLACAGAGVLAWYAIFPNHTYVHPFFIVRLVALPAAYGLMAAILVAKSLLEEGSVELARCSALALVALVVSTLAMTPVWTVGLAPKVTFARFVESPETDRVTCRSVGIPPDGRPDGVLEFGYRLPWTPLAIFGLPRTVPLKVTLVRTRPFRAWTPSEAGYVLGLSLSPSGPLLNRPDGTVARLPRQEVHLWAHFCRDGHDEAASQYRLVGADGEVLVNGR